MNYILFKADGSLDKQNLDYYIMQGSTGVDSIFIAVAGLNPNSNVCSAFFTLPNGQTNLIQGIPTQNQKIEEENYNGWLITLTDAQTLYNGLLRMAISVIVSGSQRLVNYPVALVINETGYMPDSDTGVTIEEINSYLVFLYSLEEQIANDYALKTEVVPLKTADSSTTLNDICESQSTHCFVKFNNKTYYLDASYTDGSYVCVIQELGGINRITGSVSGTTTFANALTTLTENDYLDQSSNQNITGVKTFKNRLIIDGVSGNGVIETNDKNSFARVWVDSANYVNYNLPYSPSDANQNLQTHILATNHYVDQKINEVEMGSDVIDIVGTYADLQAYDTQHVKENDLIKVISDSTHNNATSYYRWVNNAWVYVASEGPYYTTSQADNLFVTKTTQIAGVSIGSGISVVDLYSGLFDITEVTIDED